MEQLTKPKQGQDVRFLHRDVRNMVSGINSLINMTARWEGKERGIGFLQIRGGVAELVIKVADPGAGGGGGLFLPTISLTSTENPSTESHPIRFICNVVGAVDGSVVQFSANSVPIGAWPMVNQVAITDPFTPVAGTYNMRADFAGDVIHQPGFATMVQVVSARPIPNITLLSSKNPSDHGDDVYFRADLSDNLPDPLPAPQTPLPTGTVSFFHDGAPYDTATLDSGGFAYSIHNSNLLPVHNEITAHYNGDTNWGETEDTIDQIVKADANLFIDIQPEPVATGIAFNINIAVRGSSGMPTPTGQVDIHQNGNTSGWFNLDDQGLAVFRVAVGLPIGTYYWFFDYSGDANYSADFSETFTQHVVARPPTHIDVSQIGNTPFISYRFFSNYPPGTPGFFQVQLHDPTGGNYTGQIGIQLYAIGGPGYVRFWVEWNINTNWELIYSGMPNLYFDGSPMIGSTIYFYMVNGYATLWISWNVPPWSVLDFNGPAVTSGDPFGTSDYVFLRLFDPYDGSIIDQFGLSAFLNP